MSSLRVNNNNAYVLINKCQTLRSSDGLHEQSDELTSKNEIERITRLNQSLEAVEEEKDNGTNEGVTWGKCEGNEYSNFVTGNLKAEEQYRPKYQETELPQYGGFPRKDTGKRRRRKRKKKKKTKTKVDTEHGQNPDSLVQTNEQATEDASDSLQGDLLDLRQFQEVVDEKANYKNVEERIEDLMEKNRRLKESNKLLNALVIIHNSVMEKKNQQILEYHSIMDWLREKSPDVFKKVLHKNRTIQPDSKDVEEQNKDLMEENKILKEANKQQEVVDEKANYKDAEEQIKDLMEENRRLKESNKLLNALVIIHNRVMEKKKQQILECHFTMDWIRYYLPDEFKVLHDNKTIPAKSWSPTKPFVHNNKTIPRESWSPTKNKRHRSSTPAKPSAERDFLLFAEMLAYSVTCHEKGRLSLTEEELDAIREFRHRRNILAHPRVEGMMTKENLAKIKKTLLSSDTLEPENKACWRNNEGKIENIFCKILSMKAQTQ